MTEQAQRHVDPDDLVGKTFEFYGAHSERFNIDGHVYQCVEDENDGYRSMMGEMVEVDDGLDGFFVLPVATVRVDRKLDSYFDTWMLVDVSDGHEWLEFGTRDHEDYCPSFTFVYQPKEAKP